MTRRIRNLQFSGYTRDASPPLFSYDDELLQLESTQKLGFEAFANTLAVGAVNQLVAGRERPLEGAGHGRFWINNSSTVVSMPAFRSDLVHGKCAGARTPSALGVIARMRNSHDCFGNARDRIKTLSGSRRDAWGLWLLDWLAHVPLAFSLFRRHHDRTSCREGV